MENEIWKPINEIRRNHKNLFFEGYEVSNLGRVRTYKKKYGKVAKGVHNRALNDTPYVINGRPDKYGYPLFCLSDTDKKRYNIRAHTLVMQTFIGFPEEGQIILHFDDIKTNNCLDNLRYGDHKENMDDRKRNNPLQQ
jgi:hypothetical protein